MKIVETQALRKDFGNNHAVAGVDLNVSQAELFGLLGPDGAGKTSLIRMLGTILAPTSGKVTLFEDARNATPVGRIGYMPQHFSLYPDLSVAENLDFFGTIRGVPKPVRRERGAVLLERLGLAPFTKRRAGKLSGGMKQKLMLTCVLLHEPELLLLDEPTTGVDPVSRHEFWEIIDSLHTDGKTIIVATPYMDEAEHCTQLAFMNAGIITQAGTPEQIKKLGNAPDLETAFRFLAAKGIQHHD